MVLPIAAAALGALLLATYPRARSETVTGPGGREVRVHSLVLEPTEVSLESQSPGTVIAAREVRIASRLTGFVGALKVDIGSRVRAGEVLLQVGEHDVAAAVAQARGALQAAEATLADAQSNFRRYHDLYRTHSVSRQTYEAMLRNRRTAEAGVARAKAALAAAEAQRAYATVRAPVTGTVTARYVQNGDLATPGKALLAIQGEGGLQIRTDVTPRAYRSLHLGAKVTVDAAGEHLAGTVVQLNPAANPATETHQVKLDLPAGAPLSPGAYARVLVPVGKRRALMVPRSALVRRAGVPAVFIVGADGRAHLRLVRLGTRDGDRVEVSAGLRAGMRVVTDPGVTLNNDTPVTEGN